MNPLLQDIEAFLETHGMSATAFGEQALNDRHLVRTMRGEAGKPPRRIWPETEQKIRRFMATYKPEAEAA